MSVSEVVQRARERARALAGGDRVALEAIHHPDLRWTTHTGSRRDRGEYIAGNVDDGLRWHGQELRDVDVVVVGDTAVLVAIVSDDVERDGQRFVHTMPVTQTWIRTERGWLLLAGHAGPRQEQRSPTRASTGTVGSVR